MKTSYHVLCACCLFIVHTASAQLSSFSPIQIIGGIGQKLTINGSGFGAARGSNYVSFYQETASYMDTANARVLNYLSWTDTKIELEMPVAYSGKIKLSVNGNTYLSADTLKVTANQVYRKANPLDYDYLNNTNKRGGYTWYMHSTYWNNPQAKTAIEEVFKEFRCKTGVNYILATQPSDASFSLSDTINIIAPDIALSTSKAGYTDRLWSSCILGSVTFYKTATMDIRMSTVQDWYFGTGAVPAGKAKFRYVLMHEMGHSMGLGHVNEEGQTMYPSVTNLPSNNWSARDNITLDETTAISYLVNLSQHFTFNSCGISTMTPVTECQDVYGLSMGIDETLTDQGARIYPNPIHKEAFLEYELNQEEKLSISLEDLSGRKLETYLSSEIQKPGNYKQVISFPESLPNGLYFIFVATTKSQQRIKVIKTGE